MVLELKSQTTQDIDNIDYLKKETELILNKYQGKIGTLIPILQEIQTKFSYLPEISLKEVSDKMKIPLSQIYGVATFYAQFKLQPRGKNVIRICEGTACYVRGGSLLKQHLEEKLNIKVGETTPDRKFTLESVACLGTCFLAPVIMVNDEYYGSLTPKKLEKVLNKYE